MLRLLPLIILLNACSLLDQAPNTFYLTKPPRPLLPALTEDEEFALRECAPLAYTKIVVRDAQRKGYAEELEAVIDSTRSRE
jgi:hypothetical protein